MLNGGYVELKATREYCSIAEQGCVAPPGYGGGGGIWHGIKKTSLRCSECDRPVCSKCSKRRRGRRICADCLQEKEWPVAARISVEKEQS